MLAMLMPMDQEHQNDPVLTPNSWNSNVNYHNKDKAT